MSAKINHACEWINVAELFQLFVQLAITYELTYICNKVFTTNAEFKTDFYEFTEMEYYI